MKLPRYCWGAVVTNNLNIINVQMLRNGAQKNKLSTECNIVDIEHG